MTVPCKTSSAANKVVVRHRAAAALFHGQTRLRAIQRLNLALLVDTEHQRVLRRIEIEADDSRQFLEKPGVARQFERLAQVGFEIVAPPDVADGRLADPEVLRQQPATPVRHPWRGGLQRRIHDLLKLLGPVARLAAAPRRHVPQPLEPRCRIPCPPQGHRLTIHRPRPRDGAIGLPVRRR